MFKLAALALTLSACSAMDARREYLPPVPAGYAPIAESPAEVSAVLHRRVDAKTLKHWESALPDAEKVEVQGGY